MQKSSWYRGQSFLLQPKRGLDPNTTVAELFATGPMRLVVTQVDDQPAVIEALLPEAFEVTPDADSADENSANPQRDLFAQESNTFDHFLQEESARVQWEAETIQGLREERSK
jgi:hypothetical protein